MSIRYLFALDFVAPHLPPAKNSKIDINLLRVANIASQRERSQIEDSFLFVVYGSCDQEKIASSLKAYGFQRLEVRFVGEDEELVPDEAGRVSFVGDDFDEAVGDAVQSWVKSNHAGSLPLLGLMSPDKEIDGYRGVEWRWIGVEAKGAELWPLDANVCGKLLPSTHAQRAETWLAILKEGSGFEFEELEGDSYEPFQKIVQVASLCEWLHGFEAASGNGYNHFDPDETVQILGINEVLLGFEAGSAGASLEEAESEEEIKTLAVKAVTEKYRADVLSALSVFGGDHALFFALYSSIWPKYELGVAEAADRLLGLKEVEYGEIAAAWTFVTNGWHASANAD